MPCRRSCCAVLTVVPCRVGGRAMPRTTASGRAVPWRAVGGAVTCRRPYHAALCCAVPCRSVLADVQCRVSAGCRAVSCRARLPAACAGCRPMPAAVPSVVPCRVRGRAMPRCAVPCWRTCSAVSCRDVMCRLSCRAGRLAVPCRRPCRWPHNPLHISKPEKLSSN